MSRWNLAWLLTLPSVVVVGLTIAFCAPRGSKSRDQDYQNVQLMVEVLAEVDQNYVRELTVEQKKKLVEDMINGGLERLDPYSAYYNESDFRELEKTTDGKFGGIGIQVNVDRATGYLQVTSPMFGTPAYDAGILAGDLVLKVDGKATDSMRYDDLIRSIQGDPGTQVTLTVVHEGTKEPVDITVTRAVIEIQSVLGDRRMPDNPAEWDWVIDKEYKIGYLRLATFSEHTAADLKKAFEKMTAAGVRGFVLDLRDNPGGLLTSAVEVSDLFIDKGKIVSIRNRKGSEKVYEAKSAGTMMLPPSAHPMAVLINKNSASASEIVAAALQDSGRAIIVGERSFGKGSVQNVIRLPERNPPVALKLTTASYWRPTGANIHRHADAKDTDEWGVKPDAGFAVSLTDAERLQYLRWRRARDIVQGKDAKAKKPEKEEPPFTDKMLEKALEQIRTAQRQG
jgi:carboxyl-terminal processing protease